MDIERLRGRLKRRRGAPSIAVEEGAIDAPSRTARFGDPLGDFLRKRFTIRFPELTYASPTDRWYRRWVIRSVEYLAGRSYFVAPYDRWVDEHIAMGKPLATPRSRCR